MFHRNSWIDIIGFLAVAGLGMFSITTPKRTTTPQDFTSGEISMNTSPVNSAVAPTGLLQSSIPLGIVSSIRPESEVSNLSINYSEKWEQEPFMPPFIERHPKITEPQPPPKTEIIPPPPSPEPEPEPEPELNLTGIISQSDKQASIINGRVYRVGSVIGKKEVIEITANSVILKENGRYYMLKVNRQIQPIETPNVPDERFLEEFKQTKERLAVLTAVSLENVRLIKEAQEQIKSLETQLISQEIYFRYNLASAYLAGQKPDDAITEYQTIIHKKPTELMAYYQIGMIYQDYLKDKVKAIEYYQKYIDNLPANYPNPPVNKETIEKLIQDMQQ